jgi:hypothetical protein
MGGRKPTSILTMAKATKKEIITAEEQAQKFMDTYPQNGNLLHLEDKGKIANLMRQYAKWHVEAALKAALDNAKGELIDKASILKAYPVDKIK